MSLNCDLLIRRKWFTTKSTIGQIIGINTNDQSEVLSYCLEDESRGKEVKIYGCTCIPDGEYYVKVTYSERFKRELPIIYNKEINEGKPYVIFDGRNTWEGVRIHPGNGVQTSSAKSFPPLRRQPSSSSTGHAFPHTPLLLL